jgi:ABC-type phosphate transport system substrate-binding protein
MNDKEWLDKVERAFAVYVKQNGLQPQIEEFIDWLFKQYGIEHKK